ncbi:Pentatricopeptide repeat-containing protein [Thalictrum thalictroides]|uniref:Pentatricopeptide repeat-containing protein n=1 Tax=Thalictrum thalictroides TaxID=46969 RepID=A0A7J6VE33_THATH|nr:Pentatricopeptide repeat-containing protein [Thalictrum thalictroides]
MLAPWHYLSGRVRNGPPAFEAAHSENVWKYASKHPEFSGENGTALGVLVIAFPWIKGVNFNLPHVVSVAPEINGVEHVCGDMFEAVPKAEAAFLKACGLMLGLNEGKEIHGEVVKRGFDLDLFVMNGLVNRLSDYLCYWQRFGNVDRARELFNYMPKRDLVSWNCMIAAYTHVGDMDVARELFEEMAGKNVISWSIMIDGYARHGEPREALCLFQEMLLQGIRADKVSVVGAIQACGQLGALELGRWIHVYMEKNNIISDVVVQTAMLDMYMKCGSLNEARRFFNSMSQKNFVAWNVMIFGLGINGCGDEALQLFAQMVKQGILMDELTLLSVLSACNHAGLVNDGLQIFRKMKNSCGIEPKVEHYSCLVDLLSRAGKIEEAKKVIETMPVKADSALWGSLLAACRTNLNLPIAEVSLDRLVKLKAEDSGVYVLMSNIYAEKEMWGDVSRIRGLMTDRGMKKETGRSVIEVDGNVHEFLNGYGTQIFLEELECVIWSLLKVMVSAK